MADHLGSWLRGGAVWPDPPYGDVGHVYIDAEVHPYLRCAEDGEQLYEGETDMGALVFVCDGCKRILDQRRVG